MPEAPDSPNSVESTEPENVSSPSAGSATEKTATAKPKGQVRVKGRSVWPTLLGVLAVAAAIDVALIAYQIRTGAFSEGVMKGVWGLTAAVGAGIVGMIWRWQVVLQTKYRKNQVSEIRIYSYPKLVYVWPVILLGFIFYWPLDRYHMISNALEAWIYVAALATVFLTVSIDLNRIASLLWVATLTIIVLAVVIVKLRFGVTFLDRIGHWIKELSPSYSVSSGLALSIVLGIFYAVMIVGARLNDLWYISHNQFEHRTVLGKDDSLARGAKRVKASYPDILELLLLGSGTLTVYSAQGNTILASIENIPWLFFRMGRIDHILEAVEVSSQSNSVIDDESGDHDSNEDADGDHL